jgi:hypothetical protein
MAESAMRLGAGISAYELALCAVNWCNGTGRLLGVWVRSKVGSDKENCNDRAARIKFPQQLLGCDVKNLQSAGPGYTPDTAYLTADAELLSELMLAVP